jgi:uncharacterized cupredoxin-like copper-binding protein
MTRTRASFIVAVALVAPLLLTSGSFGGRTTPAASHAVTVNVTALDYSFKFSKKVAPAGKVTFVVKNAGKKLHNFKINYLVVKVKNTRNVRVIAKKTPILKPGKSAKVVVTFKDGGKFAYTSTVPGDAKKGMKGAFTVKAPKPTPPPTGGGSNLAAGKAVFVSTGCGVCHTFKAAGSTGSIGPNLDTSKLARAVVVARITTGKGTMPSYSSQLSAKQIQDVADFVFQSRAG